ncbi:hypothetical protein JRX38_03685 [Gluconobacter cerinus]|uniref:hypothetical protein n=1 Tax=Gluconobacter cerinus TaxID=38307 RepID=UPI00193F6D80|nr:hypothetical protein [Gluconobacter cerinus]MBM3097124.1 hypothetical protein [Gluconobacter cerinus]
MRKIDKQQPPQLFTSWVREKPTNINQNQRFEQLYEQRQWDIVSALRESLSAEQYYLCAYCCCSISGEQKDTMNEHVEARALAPQRALDYSNIVASCKNLGQCDNAHKGKPLPLTPLMPECETELKFSISGRVKGMTTRACATIQILNLGDTEHNNRALIEKRKNIIHSLLFNEGLNPDDRIALEDDDIVYLLIEELKSMKNGKLRAFSPVLINAINNFK